MSIPNGGTYDLNYCPVFCPLPVSLSQIKYVYAMNLYIHPKRSFFSRCFPTRWFKNKAFINAQFRSLSTFTPYYVIAHSIAINLKIIFTHPYFTFPFSVLLRPILPQFKKGKLEGKTQTRVAYKLSHFVAHMISKTWWVGIQWVTIQWVASSGSVVCGKAVCLLATWELAHFPSVFWCWRCGYELFMQHCAVLY